MRLFKVPPDRLRVRASERLSRLEKGAVLDWADVALAGSWKAMETFRRAPDLILLDEAESGLQQVLGAIDDLRKRTY